MTEHGDRANVAKRGVFLYDGQIACDVRVVRSPVRYGTGDEGDPVEVCEDIEVETFYVEYGSTTERGVYAAGGSGYPSLAAAVAAVEAAPGIGNSVKWEVGDEA
jgi:hypothetical protein